MILLYIISTFLVYLIINHLLFYKVRENLEVYKDPNLGDDPIYLAKLNASNISFLKSRLDDITKMETKVKMLNDQVNANASALQSISNSMQETGKNAIPSKSQTNDMMDLAAKSKPVGSE